MTAFSSVPTEIQAKANLSYARDPAPFRLFLAVACTLGALKIAAEIGLFFFRRWARPLFATMALASVLAPFLVAVLPPEVLGASNPPLDQSIGALLSLADGAIIALAYGSPVASLFVRVAPDLGPGVEHAG
jgi:hypothetical protein